MGSYVPNTKSEQEEMLREAGFACFEEMFSQIPQEVRFTAGLDLPDGMGEQGVYRKMEAIAEKNTTFRHIFRGAGAYHHYIPAIVDSVASKEEFVTAYTPYQAEISQGILQTIFEYQTMICELTGMDAANASVYDGATAAAEAAAMCRDRKRVTVFISETANPQVIQVIRTYCFGSGAPVVMVPEKDGTTDLQALERMLAQDGQAACVYIQQPNYYGLIEAGEKLEGIIHGAGAKFIMGCNPIALGVLKTPGEYGADIAVGDGQPLGMPLAYGGPYLGFMAARSEMMRKLPGRIVGETKDSRGERAFVLTLQAREQHIRREKASSNICSNQALCALRAGVYMTAMGAEGMAEAARQCIAKAAYFREKLRDAGLSLKYDGEYFHEFVTTLPAPDQDVPDAAGARTEAGNRILWALEEKGILGGLPLGNGEILWCATEMNTKEEMDQAAAVVKGTLAALREDRDLSGEKKEDGR